ncbi:MAG: beta-propeller fold lactonase family protein [Chloroflexi bacterium]|nr:beta-propeller fold lactonase family protein [Chloroflexota bacterium]
MKKHFIILILLFSILLSACGAQSAEPAVTETPAHNMANVFPEVEPIYETFEQDGVKVEFTVKAEDPFLGNTEIAKGAYATVRFRITDIASGNPLTEARPAAWMDLFVAGSPDDEQACQDKVNGYLKGQISNRPLVDLNSFFILAMNSGNTISVIDPLVQVGGITQLYTTLLLESPGQDWVASGDGNTLYISLPEAGKIAIADLQSFRVTDKISAGDVPVRLGLQPNSPHLWVGNDSKSARDSGVTVIDSKTHDIVSSLTLGRGHHELAFTPDGKYILVTSESDNEVALINTKNFKVVESSTTGDLPVAVKVSPDGRRAFVANGGEGTVDIFSLPDLALQTSLQVDPGLTGMSLAPDGRWAFVLNPNRNRVYLIDTASGELRQILEISAAPDQVIFGKESVYIRPLNGTSLFSFALSDLESGQTLKLTEVPYARRAPGESAEHAIANPLAALPDEGAILVANPADNMIYYLIEGTLSPAGSYQDQATLPRAVTFVDRSLKQEAPGIYSGRVLIPFGGAYQVALMLDTPKLMHCFDFTAKPGEAEVSAQAQIKIEALNPPSQIKRGEMVSMNFLVTDSKLEQPVDGIEDFVVSVNQIGGNWSQRYLAKSVGGGMYEIQVTIPQSGSYNLLLGVSSRNFGLDSMAPLSMQVVE